MKKLFTFLAGAALLGSLGACSSDEPTKGPDGPDKNPTEDGAYLSVRLTSAGEAFGRALSDAGYEDSDADELEHTVKHAQFFFFDENGTFVLKGKTLTGLNVEKPNPDDNENIEYIDKKNIVVLNKLTESNKYPSYMLTVLNAPTFNAAGTLAESIKQLSNYQEQQTIESDGTATANDYFVMSTSSYFGKDKFHLDKTSDITDLTYKTTTATYFATYIPQSYYQESEDKAKETANAIEVYVERLAAKVEVKNSLPTTGDKAPLEVAGRKLYPVTQSVGSNDHNQGTDVLETTLYIEPLSWDLNATLTQSHMMKNLAESWNTDAGLDWINNSNYHRSHWAISTIYDKELSLIKVLKDIKDLNTEPGDIRYITNVYKPISAPSDGGNYKKHLDKKFDTGKAYCNENTNTVPKIFGSDATKPDLALVDARYVTHAVLLARICDEKGNGRTMIQAGSIMYDKDAYISYILNSINNGQNKINLFTLKEESTSTGDAGTTVTKTYKPIDASFFNITDVDVVSTKTKEKIVGASEVIINEDEFNKAGLQLYAYENPSDLSKDPVLVSAEKKTELLDNLKTLLIEEQPDKISHPDEVAIMCDNGLCVYYVPIEHNAKGEDAVEGYYGVVRNHWYRLSITELTKPGHGVWEPEHKVEVLIPDDPKSKSYFLGARINILSWKIVNQTVKL